jgi:hypothetical protein
MFVKRKPIDNSASFPEQVLVVALILPPYVLMKGLAWLWTTYEEKRRGT